MVGWDQRFHIADRLDKRAGRPQRERVIQDVEIPVDRLPEFLDWFDAEIGMRPVWLCPLRLRDREWPTYPLSVGTTYVNVGFWGTVHVGPDREHAPKNRAIEAKVLSSAAPRGSTPKPSTIARPSTTSTTVSTWPPSSESMTPTTG